MGIESTLWHVFPAPLTDAADIIPLSLYLLIAAYLLLERIVSNRTIVFAALSLLVLFLILIEPLHLLQGSLVYLIIAGVFGLLFYGIKQKYKNLPSLWIWILLVFGSSILFRTIDSVLCESFGIGTHFLWHVLNAIAVYLLIRFLVQLKSFEKTN